MKQHITLGQMKAELTNEKVDELLNWLNKKHGGIHYQISIGQMLEFLEEKKGKTDIVDLISDPIPKGGQCNALWEEVKEVLEK